MSDPAAQSITVSLPIADRPASSAFYRTFLGQDPSGEPQDDGEPEPLQFVLNDGTRLMLIPTGGFAWVVGDDHPVAGPGQVEVLLSRAAASEEEVRSWCLLALSGGGRIVAEPNRQPWGYTAVVADPDGHLWQLATG
ncbi:VOC family protein [Nocardioides sp. zg-536]|uniref:VOC family protein n=1 Tax=Nocardioides faecalis TaxID=2803858 RepID=A0A939BXE3_9ACTN|nr:VOC family protein [Nocardioides faecalis]MBM9461637.1 VOC family protein [Nocardioides faecalis]MBS4753753.1 VOC family protein [Nocardioides faecalis]QVI57403.1 VOC family protein [Nocardioides faecalis]